MVDPNPDFVRFLQSYVYMRMRPFVALEILEVDSMPKVNIFSLYRECFRTAGVTGLIACTKYLCGALKLEEIPQESLDFPEVAYE